MKGSLKCGMYHGDLGVVKKRGDTGACGCKLTGSSSFRALRILYLYLGRSLGISNGTIESTGSNLSMLHISQQHNDTSKNRGITGR
jgi:hypothetical protein